MFTGLIDNVGTIERTDITGAGLEFLVRCLYTDLVVGESIAVNGVCLTVLECGQHQFTAAAMTTTLDRTTLNRWSVGDNVNLERALRASDRLGGHIVQGHVDGLGTVVEILEYESALLVDVEIPSDLFELMVPHGSVTIDGVSLTVNEIPRENVVQVSLIEYTRAHTTLGSLRVGAQIHVEGDVIGKYVRRIVTPYTSVHV